MSNHRRERVRELLKRQIGEVIRREIPVEQAGLVSVNDVEMASDLKQATVFVSVFGNAEQQKTGLAQLEKSRGRIQDLVAKAVILKYTPRLRFVVDDSIVRGTKVLRILDELEQQSTSSSTSPPPPPED